ncbi:MAG: NAD(P)H-hydrate epimerase [Stomatobaculum sp.]|nr:NAD(P)H-hydrate epimerase [Stomatobaculum sp.]
MIITGTQAKAADRYAIDVLKIPSLTLMERASRFVANAVLAAEKNAPAVILCGVGNNGADGVCVGKMLREAGLQPKVLICGSLEKASWEFLRQLSEFKASGGIPEYIHKSEDFQSAAAEAVLLVDAAFGIGLKRPLEGIWKDVILAADSLDCCRIAVDVPSGINSDTGEAMGAYVRADETFTFGRNKTGLTTGTGAAAAGRICVCDIGIPDEAYDMVMNTKE